MANIGSKRQEKQRVNALKEGIVLALHNQGKPRLWIAKTMEDNYNLVCRVIGRGISLEKRFELSVVEQLVAAARRIADFDTYQIELNRIAEQTKQEAQHGPVINTQAINISCRKMYAERMADLWARLSKKEQAYIFKYQNTVIDPKNTLEGRLVVVPKDVLPAAVRGTHSAERPYLALTYERGEVELCDEDASTISLRIKGIGKLHPRTRKNAKNPVSPMQSLLPEQVRVICADYFKRNGYNTITDLHKQIEERALDQIAPIVLKQRTQLAGSALYRKSAK